MRTRWDARGMTLIEVLVAISIVTVALLALLGMLSGGSLEVAAGGGQSKSTGYARQQVEQLRNQPLCPAAPPCFPTNGTDNPDPGNPRLVRTWTITSSGPTVAPNRLWDITVTVTSTQASPAAAAQNITIQTMRAE